MSEYINKYIATSIPVLPKEHRKQFTSYDDAFETGWNEALSCVNIVPSADVVEVVRCKDCIHNDQCKHRVVMWVEDPINTWHKDIDYCSYGERKDNEDK